MSYVLKIGSRGDAVTELQTLLIRQNFLPEPGKDGKTNLDGQFGKQTEDAVKAAQRDHEVRVDGVVGPETATALGFALPSPTVLPEAGHIFSQSQLAQIAVVVDALIPTGFLDPFDDSVIAWTVEKFDAALFHLLTPKMVTYLRSTADGIEDITNLAQIKKTLVTRVVQEINISLAIFRYIPEEIETAVFTKLIDALIDALTLGRDFDTAMRLIDLKQEE